MPKEEQEKKKPGIVRRIFKWIGLGLLTVLIILGLVFQAPWKVITLLLIVLAACTILPKQLRKWFWLSVGVVVIALIVWVFLPQETEGWRPYTFDEELAALEAKRAIPDEENAAIIYNQLLDSYDSNSFSHDFLVGEVGRIIRFEPWSGDDYPEVARWLGSHERIIARLLEAAQIEKCRFAIHADLVGFDSTMNRLSPMRQWAYLLMSSANKDIAESHPDKAFEKVKTVLQMAKHQFQQPTIIDTLVGIALDALGHKQFNRIVMSNDTTEEHLSAIEDTLSKNRFNWSCDFPRILEHEKLFAKNFWGMFYAINPEGKVRRSPNPMAIIRFQCTEELPQLTYWQRKRAKASTLLGWFFLPASPQKAGGIIDESYEKYYAMAEPDFDWQKEREKPTKTFRLNYRYLVEDLAGILKPACHRIHDLYLRLMTDNKGGRIIIALRQYKNQNGFWPVNLNDVKSMAPVEIFVDPTNGGDFVYEITEENFRLYSKGKNNVDEDGKYKRRYGETSEGDDWLIWPPRSRKAKEESTDAEQQ
jgi:hypothetical protein